MNDPGAQDTGSMDILYLLERLEEVLSAGSRLPFTSRALIDDEECFAIVDQIRLSLPNEIRQARKVNADREALLAETQARAQQILQAADQEARELVDNHQIARQADAHAREIVHEAERRAEQIRHEADDYAFRVLQDLDHRLDSLLSVVRNGLQSLQQQPEPPQTTDDPYGAERHDR